MKNINWNLVVTRHQGLVDYLKKEKIVGDDIEVITHATVETVSGKNVIGVLPHSLSSLTLNFGEVPLALTPEMRGKELTCDDVAAIAGALSVYTVRKVV